MARIDKIQRRILADSEKSIELWRRLFGKEMNSTWDETQPKDFHGGEPILSKAIAEIVEEAKEHLNVNAEPTRHGEASLFIREPHNDRLVLGYSTSMAGRELQEMCVNPTENYDPIRRVPFYSLCDRLSPSAAHRKNERSRDQRGLTGWIAVSGHYLLINGEKDSATLDIINKIRPETSPEYDVYGPPFWGHRLSEAIRDLARPKRYLGIPIKSVDSPKITVGVLRYSCPLEGASLTINDLAFLEEMGSILSALLHLEGTKVRALRAAELPHEIERLKRSGNLHSFLSFMSVGLRSKIISTYIDIGVVCGHHESRLRMVDAVGIDGRVTELRPRLLDYEGMKSPAGFTWWLFNEAPTEPTIRPSVVEGKSWSGSNTEIFYQAVLSGLGITETYEIRKAIKQYKIKIMGMPIVSSGKGAKLGVLKVEFPSCFDDNDIYNDDDKIFFKECARVIGEYLENMTEVLSGDYSDPLHSNNGQFFRSFTEILRTDLVAKDECAEFWESTSRYIEQNKEQLRTESVQIFSDVPKKMKREFLKGMMEVAQKLPSKLPGLVEYLLKSEIGNG